MDKGQVREDTPYPLQTPTSQLVLAGKGARL